MPKKEKKVTGYDKYVDWKMFSIPVVLLFALLLIPTPYGMKDVGTEYRIGPKVVIEHINQELFSTTTSDAPAVAIAHRPDHGAEHEHGRPDPRPLSQAGHQMVQAEQNKGRQKQLREGPCLHRESDHRREAI